MVGMNTTLPLIVLTVCVVAVGATLYMDSRRQKPTPPPVSIPEPVKTVDEDPVADTVDEFLLDDPKLVTPSPTDDLSMLDFAFENLAVGEGMTPDAETKMTRTTAAETQYKLVKCWMANGYAIKWSGRYFTVNDDGTTRWDLKKEEPGSCFEIKPGFCGDSGAFIMLRSMFNGHFLRVSGTTQKVVAVDSPTANNATQYCWLFRNTQKYARLPCGTMYRPEYGRVVTIPCTIIKDPPEGGTCMNVTDGYKADCCGRHPGDPSCRSVYIREVVGRTLAEAATYIRTRFPNYTILKCARGDACERASPFPLPKPDTIVLVYDPRLGTITKPAYRFI